MHTSSGHVAWPAGGLRADLTDAGAGASCLAGGGVPRCFHSFTVTTTTSCELTVAPSDPGAASTVLVPTLFVGSFAAAYGLAAAPTYQQLLICPAAGHDALSTTFTDATALTALDSVLRSSIWGDPLTASVLSPLSAGSGVLTSTDTSTGSSCLLKWQIITATVS